MKNCNQCGKCCINYSNGGLSASKHEIETWDTNRPDIYLYINNGNIWMSPDDGRQLKICPWLTTVKGQKKTNCSIYFDRPDDCKYYPVTIEQMIQDECEMLETKDLRNPKQAQKTLDRLMADSRPALV